MPRWCVLILLCLAIPTISSNGAGESQEIIKCAKGFCLPKYLCPNGRYEKFDPDNAPIILLRMGGDDDDDECVKKTLVCCKNETQIITNTKCAGGYCVRKELCPSESNEESNEQITCPKDGEMCCSDATQFADPMPGDAALNEQCGRGNPNGLHYNFLGNRTYAQYAEFPWIVAILQDGVQHMEFVGSGSLVHPKFVLSAAHIFKSNVTMIARFGEWNIVDDNEPYPTQDIKIHPGILTHPEYHPLSLRNDIALVKLERDVHYREHIRPICLPNPGDVFDGQRCVSTGWGVDVRINDFAPVLKRVDLPIVPRQNCVRKLRATRLGPFFQLHHSVLCAGGEAGADTCDGDGGSPLACPTSNGTYVLAGIVSWGVGGCNEVNVPAAYVDVAVFVDWINATITSVVR